MASRWRSVRSSIASTTSPIVQLICARFSISLSDDPTAWRAFSNGTVGRLPLRRKLSTTALCAMRYSQDVNRVALKLVSVDGFEHLEKHVAGKIFGFGPAAALEGDVAIYAVIISFVQLAERRLVARLGASDDVIGDLPIRRIA